MTELTARQRQILDWITDFTETNGMPPTVREIGGKFDISSAGVFGHLKAIERKGYLKRGGLGARSLQMTFPARARTDTRQVPLVGRIAAGVPLLAVENAEGSVAVDDSLVRSSSAQHFALRVKGDSMIEAGIIEGDIVVIEKRCTARNGQIVVALVDDEATLKYFYREKDRIRLQPANSRMDPIYVTNVEVQGVVCGLIRSMR